MYEDEVGRLQATPMLRGLEPAHLKLLVLGGMRTRYAPGEAVIREGEPAEAVHVVLSGEASARSRGGVPFPPFGPGSIFGDVSVFLDRPYRMSVEAATVLVTLRLDKATFVELVSQMPDLALAVIRDLAGRLHDLRDRVEAAPPAQDGTAR
ncbi:Crp/Fnr family transcriptional regulator [Salinarimonas soli]|uniref:Cyclic nucleotide-binding domain-containing protein n=1 Tax=Salinarimonas soli TaxID=1638099 RepID=A0A5B2V9M6_9HYPH|nr:cyclic nucleotide-binding domain-containing protein [Salinarimonas soli]KAA2235546.1 cyclic nucleotide-binding domain-containing protein [Salinarimonas soli]